jgi:hypothetical protein
MSFLTSHNSGYKYLLNAIDAFSKYAYSVPIRSRTAEAVVSAFRSILARTGGRRPLVVRTDKGKEFVNAKSRKLLYTEGIEMRVCRYPDVKCAIVKRFNRTLKSKLYKWFTWKNTHRYVHVLEKFVSGYNDAVHSSTGMAPSLVSDKDVLLIWERMRNRQARIKKVRSPPIYSVGQTVRISKGKMQFAKGFEQNWSLEEFKISKVLRRSPRHLYELEDRRGESIEGQFYAEELISVKIGKKTEYLGDKILDSRVRRGIREHLVRWRGYGPAFESWIPASNIRRRRRSTLLY